MLFYINCMHLMQENTMQRRAYEDRDLCILTYVHVLQICRNAAELVLIVFAHRQQIHNTDLMCVRFYSLLLCRVMLD